jgi:soluble lytic murein transglycosylase-like protein
MEDIPYPETRQYVKRILGTYLRYRDARHPEFIWGLKSL